MTNEIGSTYYLPPHFTDSFPKKSFKRPEILNVHERYVSTCRSAIGLCLDELSVERKVALLPSFTCESVLNPFLKRGYVVYPYPIGRDLDIEWSQFESVIKRIRPSVILTHPYFGFNTTEALRDHIEDLRINEGIIFIEDMTQSLFSGFKPLPANYHVGSIRKWMPIPDGAFTTAHFCGDEEDDELVEAKIKAFTNKGNYIINNIGDKESFRKEFSVAERILDSRDAVYSMSSISREIYDHTDIERLKEQRWLNYVYLLNHLTNDTCLSSKMDVLLYPLSGIVCPFHFPVYVKDRRRELQQFLAQNNIYATIIWGCPKEFEVLINNDARYIYDHILCFHVDQRYCIDDMKRIISTLNAFFMNN